MKHFAAGVLVGALLVPIAVLLALRLGLWPVEATVSPPAWEARVLGGAVHAAIRARAPRVANPLPATEETLRAGMRLYRSGCEGCHGSPRGESAWGTRGFSPRAPQFAARPPILSESEMFSVVKNGIRYSGMAAWRDLSSDPEIWQMVTFLSRLGRLPAPVAAEWSAPPR
jgi:mono/diheme cytochrome c family protein